jgi:hypothetical protein
MLLRMDCATFLRLFFLVGKDATLAVYCFDMVVGGWRLKPFQSWLEYMSVRYFLQAKNKTIFCAGILPIVPVY